MNNSYRLGGQVPFNKKAGKSGDNADAAEHFAKLHGVMADGVGVPEDGNHYIVGPTLTFDPNPSASPPTMAGPPTSCSKARAARALLCRMRKISD
ncbi:MAG: hypothetical protein KTR15_02665 [Phycisphaeraceae bacterium]|nr:hypothetical protein [Phycisphaeraceae bacterium]